MDFSKLETGVKRRPLKIVLSGVEGVGKTTFAADAPGVIFADLEHGSETLDVTRFPELSGWFDLLGAVGFLFEGEHEFETLVVDSMSVAEKWAEQKVASDANVLSINDIGYGKGFGLVSDEIDSLFRGFDALVEKGMNVIIICHSEIKRVDDPTGDSYDKHAIALGKRVEPKVKQWGDVVLFADHDKSIVEKGEGFAKRTIAKSYGERIMWTEHRASHDAKNRFGLPERMKLDWSEFAGAIDNFYESKGAK